MPSKRTEAESRRIAELEEELSHYKSIVEQLKKEKEQFERSLLSVRS
jgi:DNA-binding protein H-NS